MRTEPFYFHNGRAAHTAADLLEAIEESSESVFREHVTVERNDFATWLEHGLGDQSLAEKLRRTTDRIATISILRDYLRHRYGPKHVPHVFHPALQREFLLGFLVGVIVGVVLLQVIRGIA